MNRLVAFYIGFIIFLTAFSYLFVDQNLVYLKDFYTGFYTDNRETTSLLYLTFIILYFVFYALFLRKIRKSSFNIKFVILATTLVLFFAYPAMLSYDIFNYVTTSKVLYGYHENPYLFTPQEFAGDPLLEFTRATNKIALYGPAWLLISVLPFALGFGNFLLTLFGFKLIAAASYLLTSLLILKITKNKFSTAIFALNPLVIIESLVSSHNDTFMMLLALSSFYFLFSAEKVKSIFYLIASVLVKYATLFLVPIFIFQFWKILKNRSHELNLTYFVASVSMLIIFFLSFFREEIYPWYGIWFLTFVSTIPNKRILLYLSLGLSLGLMLSYLPFMSSGTYFGSTPYIKNALIAIPTIIVLILGLKRRLWVRKYFWQQP